jgi:hypothetical protein
MDDDWYLVTHRVTVTKEPLSDIIGTIAGAIMVLGVLGVLAWGVVKGLSLAG